MRYSLRDLYGVYYCSGLLKTTVRSEPWFSRTIIFCSTNWNLYVYLKITKIKHTVTLLELVLAVYFAKCIVNSFDYSDRNIDFVMRRTYFLYVKLSDFINRIHKFNRIRRWVECIKASAIYQISRIQVSTLFLIKATMSGRVSGSIKHLKPSIA